MLGFLCKTCKCSRVFVKYLSKAQAAWLVQENSLKVWLSLFFAYWQRFST